MMALDLEDVERINDLIVQPIVKRIDGLADDLKGVQTGLGKRPCEKHAIILDDIAKQLKENQRAQNELQDKIADHEVKIKTMRFKLAFVAAIIGSGLTYIGQAIWDALKGNK